MIRRGFMKEVTLSWALRKEIGAGNTWDSRRREELNRAQAFKHLVY